MFEFLAFIFKIIFASFFGALINFSFEKDQLNNEQILHSSLVALFSCSIISMSLQFPEGVVGIVTGSSIIASLTTTLFISKEVDINSKIVFIFSSVIGMIIANGLIFQGIAYALLFIFIKKYIYTIINSFIIKEETKEEENN